MVTRKDGSCYMGAAVDNDGLDDMDERAYIFDERRFASMDYIGYRCQGTHNNEFAIMGEDVYGGSSQG